MLACQEGHCFVEFSSPEILTSSLYLFWLDYGPEVDSVSNRSKYEVYQVGGGGGGGGKGGRCVGLTTFLPSCDGCQKFWKSHFLEALRAHRELYRASFTLPYLVFILHVLVFLCASCG
jgi:hypothetical protein